MVERLAIRSLVAVTLAIAASTLIWAAMPMDAEGRPDLPGPAFGQIALYRLETGLLVFYGGLLLVTPFQRKLEEGISELAQKMNDAHIELDRLKDQADRDNS